MNSFETERMNAMTEMVEMGWGVIPATIGSKLRPLTDGWQKRTSDDCEELFIGYEKFPNLAIVTGNSSGIFVIDIDEKNGKSGSQSLLSEYGDDYIESCMPDGNIIAQTPTGGKHLFFSIEGLDVSNSADVLPGIDIRGEGGCVFATPSVRLLDKKWIQYRWLSDWTIKPPTAPEWVLSLLSKAKEKKGSNSDGEAFNSGDLLSIMTGISEGARDEQINRFAWYCVGKGLTKDVVMPFCLTAADYCQPALEHDVVVDKVERAFARKTTSKKDIMMKDIIAKLKDKK